MPWFSCIAQNRLTVRGNNSQGYKVDCKIAIRIFVVWRVKELIEKSIDRLKLAGKISGSSTPYIVLEEPNYQFVKETFLEKYNNDIRRFKNIIAMYESKIAAIENYKEDAKC